MAIVRSRQKERFLVFLYSVIGLSGCSIGAKAIIEIEEIIVITPVTKLKYCFDEKQTFKSKNKR